MSTTQPDIIRLARKAGFCTGTREWDQGDLTVGSTPFVRPHGLECLPELERFATLVIADFLHRTGQYVTNDASREAAIREAVAAQQARYDELFVAYHEACVDTVKAAAAEREACAKVCEVNHGTTQRNLDSFQCAAAIRARGTP